VLYACNMLECFQWGSLVYHVCNIILFMIRQANKWKDQFQGWLKEWTDLFAALKERLLQSRSYVVFLFSCNVTNLRGSLLSLA